MNGKKLEKINNSAATMKGNGIELWSGHALYSPSNCAAKENKFEQTFKYLLL